jgi:ABC-type transport system involved in multi-copper enzyme maturation permease subunit
VKRPIFALDPLIVKELSGSSRRWQTYAGRAVHLALLGVVVWNFTRSWEQRAAWLTLSDYASLGHELFEGFFGLQMGMVTLAAVSAASDMVTKETRGGTLGLLASTPLTPWNIVLGKWKAALAQTSTLVLCGVPILAVCVYLQGATAWDLLYSTSLTVTAAMLGAALALFLSTVLRLGITATILSLALLAAYTLVPIWAVDVPFRGSPESWRFLYFIHPVFAAVGAASPYAATRYPGVDFAWIPACLVSGVLVGVLLRAAARRVAALSVRPPAPPVLARTFEAMDRFYERVGPVALRRIRFFADPGVWESQPLLWKELRTRASGKLRNSVRIAVVLLVLLSLAFWLGMGYLTLFIWVTAVGYLFLALSNGVGLFVTEKEERKLESLLSTPVQSGQIVRSKLIAGLVPLAPGAVILMLLWAVSGWTYRISTSDVLMTLAVVFLPALLAYVVGAVASLHARSVPGAYTAAFSVLVGLLVVLPFLEEMLIPRTVAWETRQDLLAAINPAIYIEKMADACRWRSRRQTPLESISHAFYVFSAIYGAASAGLVAHLRSSFNRVTGRV